MRNTIDGELQPIEQFVQNEFASGLSNSSICISDEEKMSWASLFSIEGVGPQTFYFILNCLKKNRISWSDFWVGKNGLYQKISIPEKIEVSIKKFKKEYTIYSYWQLLLSKGISVVSIFDSQYPFLLKKISDFPPLLFVKGEQNFWNNLPIAVIGTRKMTSYGRMVTNKIVTELVVNEASIISGFMYGVDVTAQQTAIKQGGCTVGVLGYGFDYIFPRHQTYLLQEMLQTKRAVFISEYAPFVSPTKGTFPRRNRIIAGMSLGVVVAEAGPKSGTQITVGYALDYGRDVFAVSGPVTSIYHEGTKQMINQGAVLIGSGNELLSNLSVKNWGVDYQKKTTHIQEIVTGSLMRNSLDQAIVDALRIMPLTTGGLSDQLQVDGLTITKQLAQLELKGLVKCYGSYWQTKS